MGQGSGVRRSWGDRRDASLPAELPVFGARAGGRFLAWPGPRRAARARGPLVVAGALAAVLLTACTGAAGSDAAPDADGSSSGEVADADRIPDLGADDAATGARDNTDGGVGPSGADPADGTGSTGADPGQAGDDPTEAATDHGSSDIDITVVPDEITEEYVEAVLAELERLYAEALALLREDPVMRVEVADRVGEIFHDDLFVGRLQGLERIAEGGFDGIREAEDIRPRQHRVVELLQVEDGCLWVETELSYDGIVVDPPPPEPAFVLLEPKETVRPVVLNDSPWVFGLLPAGNPDDLREQRPC